MIQKTNARRGSTVVAPYRQSTSADSDGPETWGTWLNGRFYTLDVIQQPIRARMCGFGDKDRRPLAPAAVVKMVVKRNDDSIVDEDELDCSFFLVTADLWSSDGKREMNLVLHPTSSDRYITTNAPKRRRGNATAPQPLTPADQHSPPDPGTSPSSSRIAMRQPGHDVQHQSTGLTPISPMGPGYGTQQGYPFPQHGPNLGPDSIPFQPVQPYNAMSDPSAWSYGIPPTSPSSYSAVPSISRTLSTGMVAGMGSRSGPAVTATDPWQQADPSAAEADTSPYRSWTSDPQYGTLEPLQSAPVPVASGSSTTLDQPLRSMPAPPAPYPSDSTWPPPAPASDAYAASPTTAVGPHNPPYDQSMYASASYGQRAPPPTAYSQTYAPSAPNPASTIPPLPRHTYTRTLVGPLSANACRLLDEHRKPGVFFLFQDLSIRTEGTFRLRLRLMNIGAPPAPESGALSVHTDVSPVLAQTFTEPFDVYSAKRFPGVPDTTALSIAFGNQGQKLPLRNRHGTKQGTRRRRDDSDSDDSDGA